jgi:hypothetical protein
MIWKIYTLKPVEISAKRYSGISEIRSSMSMKETVKQKYGTLL